MLSLSRQQTIVVPPRVGAQEKSGGHIKKISERRHCAPTCKLLPTPLQTCLKYRRRLLISSFLQCGSTF